MRRIGLGMALVAGTLVGTHARADLLYPADFEFTVTSSVQVDNIVIFFTQTETPRGTSTTLSTSTRFVILADEPTVLQYSLSGPPPFAVYQPPDVGAQYGFLLGTYLQEDESLGLAALLTTGTGEGQSFESIFPGYTEDEVVGWLLDVYSGDSDRFINGLDNLFPFNENSLAVQPEYSAVVESKFHYELEGDLILFSDGVKAGPVTGGYTITGPPFGPGVVPEPGTLAAAGLGAALGGLALLRRRR